MKRGIIFLSCLFLFAGFVIANNHMLSNNRGWNKFSNNSSNGSGGKVNGSSGLVNSGVNSGVNNQGHLQNLKGSVKNNEPGIETKYTSNFYLALGLLIVGILIVVYLVFSLLKRPKDKWK